MEIMEESGAVISKFGHIIRIYFTFVPFLDTQILTTLCICFTAVSVGANHAITSAIVFAFQMGTDDQMEMTMEEASWLRKETTDRQLDGAFDIELYHFQPCHTSLEVFLDWV